MHGSSVLGGGRRKGALPRGCPHAVGRRSALTFRLVNPGGESNHA